MLRSTLSLMLFALIQISAHAQTDFGVLTGGIESNSVLYRDMTFRSNNYLKLDWKFKGFSAGIQAEYYPNPLLGYDINLKGIGLPGKYVAWNSRSWSLTIFRTG